MSAPTIADGDFPGGWEAYRQQFPGADYDTYAAEWGLPSRPRLVPVPVPSDSAPTLSPIPQIPQVPVSRRAWEARPCPLTPSEGPPFPVQQLPPRVRPFVEAVAESLQVPVDLIATLTLVAVATAVAGKAEVQPKPGWPEPLNLWVINVLPPAARKSAAMSAVTGPLHDMQADLQEQARAGISEAKAAKKIAEKRADAAESSAVKSFGAEGAEAAAEAADLRVTADSIDIPAPPRLLAGDITPEQVSVMLAEQQGRLGIFSAEGGLFGTMAGRYSGAPNPDVFLQGHAGDPHTVDRVGREPLHVPRPALSLGLAVQPDVVREVGLKSAMRDRGLPGRFLWVVPPSGVGSRSQDAPAVPADLKRDWHNLLRQFVYLDVPADRPMLTFDEAAYAAFRKFGADLEPRLSPDGGDLAGMGDWAGKLHGLVARLAALLHLIEHGPAGLSQPVGEPSVKAAVAIGKWAVPHALAAYGMLGAHRDMGDGQRLLRWLGRHRQGQVTVREAQQALKPAFTAESARAAFDVLDEHGWVRRVEDDRGGSGPRSERYEVHPQLLGGEER